MPTMKSRQSPAGEIGQGLNAPAAAATTQKQVPSGLQQFPSAKHVTTPGTSGSGAYSSCASPRMRMVNNRGAFHHSRNVSPRAASPPCPVRQNPSGHGRCIRHLKPSASCRHRPYTQSCRPRHRCRNNRPGEPGTPARPPRESTAARHHAQPESGSRKSPQSACSHR